MKSGPHSAADRPLGFERACRKSTERSSTASDLVVTRMRAPDDPRKSRGPQARSPSGSEDPELLVRRSAARHEQRYKNHPKVGPGVLGSLPRRRRTAPRWTIERERILPPPGCARVPTALPGHTFDGAWLGRDFLRRPGKRPRRTHSRSPTGKARATSQGRGCSDCVTGPAGAGQGRMPAEARRTGRKGQRVDFESAEDIWLRPQRSRRSPRRWRRTADRYPSRHPSAGPPLRVSAGTRIAHACAGGEHLSLVAGSAVTSLAHSRPGIPTFGLADLDPPLRG